MYNKIIDDKNKCYGCGACVAICPKQCLTMCQDELGFKYVKIDKDKCISCGMCSKVCQVINHPENQEEFFKRYYGQSKREAVLNRSSSGGVFTELADYVLKRDGKVWGVLMNEEGENEFTCASTEDEVERICGSKYVEVKSFLPFKKIKEQINQGELVLFTGTPCQVRALKVYLGEKTYDNLILVDLLCYGIQSPNIWKKYLNEINPKKLKIAKIHMRYKKPGWENYAIKITFKNGTNYKKSRWKDPYMLTYATNLYNRQSCEQCEAKKFPRVSDITIGDFWQIDTLRKIPKEINVNKGVSVILANTKKGNEIVNQISKQMFIKEIPKEIFPNMINRYSECSKKHPQKEEFIKLTKEKGFQYSVNQTIDKKKKIKEKCRFYWLNIKRKVKRIIVR